MLALEPRSRAAVVLRYYHDLDYATIATILGTNANNAGVILHRAVEKLRHELGRDEPGSVVLEEVRRG